MRSVFRIDNDDIAILDQSELPRVMNHLIAAESLKYGIPAAQTQLSLRITDPDEGIDGRISVGSQGSPWIPSVPSVWQFKASKTLDAATVSREVAKPGVVGALQRGDTYCLAWSADPVSQRIDDVNTWLTGEVRNRNPLAAHKLLSARDLALWCTEHPVMLFDFGRPVAGWWRLDLWLSEQPPHKIPYEPDSARIDSALELSESILADSGPVHVRVQGLPGVGKTRLVLEALRSVSESVLYAPEPPGDPSFFHWLASYETGRAILVVDDCSLIDARRLAGLAQMSGGRLRLVTIGPAAIRTAVQEPHVIHVNPLDENALLPIVTGVAPLLDPVDQRWASRVSEGHVKIATSLAVQMSKGTFSVTDLAAHSEVQAVMQALLPDDRCRRAMGGLALMTRVGWDGLPSSEGQMLAEFVGLGWTEMREIIAQMWRMGLVVKEGEYRYVTPEILAIWLAAEYWSAQAEDLESLHLRLPDDDSRASMGARRAALSGAVANG